MQTIKKILYKTWPFVLLSFLCLWALRPLFHAGLFPMHDDEQVARLFEMVKVLGQGQLPPRWVPDLGFGYGYPLFNYYPPFVYYLGAFFHLFQFSYIVSTKLVMASGFLFAAYFMYLWVKNRFGQLAGIFAAFLYTYAPYHAVDLYVRGALSEFFSFVFIPALFWSLDRLAKKQTKGNIVLVSIFLCLVVLTHTLVALQLSAFLLLYLLFLLWENRRQAKRVLPAFILIAALGFGLSAYFAIPSVVEKQYTLVDQILTKQLANYSLHFVCPSQFWSSQWGYGGSVPGCVDGLSFQVGKIQLISVLFAGLAALFSMAFLKKKKGQVGIVIFVGILFVLSLFLATGYSKWIWDSMQPLSYIQFPWRFLLFSALFSSFLGGYVIFFLKEHVSIKVTLAICLILAALGLFQVRNDFQPQRYLLVQDDHYIEHNDIQWRVSGLSYEYVPKQVATRLSSLQTTELAIDKTDIPTLPYTVVSGNMAVSLQKNTAAEKMLLVQSKNAGVLQINTYAFPGWKVFVDGKEVAYSAANRLHLMQVSLTRGAHTIRALFTNTPVRLLSDGISVVSLIVLVFLGFFPKKRKQ